MFLPVYKEMTVMTPNNSQLYWDRPIHHWLSVHFFAHPSNMLRWFFVAVKNDCVFVVYFFFSFDLCWGNIIACIHLKIDFLCFLSLFGKSAIRDVYFLKFWVVTLVYRLIIIFNAMLIKYMQYTTSIIWGRRHGGPGGQLLSQNSLLPQIASVILYIREKNASTPTIYISPQKMFV